MTNKSPLSGLLLAAFGERTLDASATLDAMEKRPVPAVVPIRGQLKNVGQLKEQHAGQHDGQLSEQPAGQLTEQLEGQLAPVEQLVGHLSEYPAGHPDGQLTEQVVGQPSGQLDLQSRLLLTKNQVAILQFLYEKGGGFTNMQVLCNSTGIAYGTARHCIAILETGGYITGKKARKQHAFHGFVYTLDEQRCREQLGQLGGQVAGQLEGQLLTCAIKRVLEGEEAKTLLPSKSTVPTAPGQLEGQLTGHQKPGSFFADPEHLYWKDLGLTEKKVASWMKETEMDTEEIDLSLRYARFTFLKDPGKVKSPIDLFYTIIKRDGCFLRPSDYKSLKQIRLDRAVAERERRLQEDLQEERLDRELEFDKIFQQKDSDEFLRLKTLAGKSGGMALSGRMLETSMREAYFSSLDGTSD